MTTEYSDELTSIIKSIVPVKFVFSKKSKEFDRYFIYKNCPRYTSETIIGGIKKCKCTDTTNSFLYIEYIFNLAHYRCVSSCPKGYYYYFGDYENNLCTEVGNSTPRQGIRSNNSIADNCDSENPFLVEYVKIGNNQFYYCLSECPASLPFYKNSIIEHNGKKCLDKCPENNFYYSDTKECI